MHHTVHYSCGQQNSSVVFIEPKVPSSLLILLIRNIQKTRALLGFQGTKVGGQHLCRRPTYPASFCGVPLLTVTNCILHADAHILAAICAVPSPEATIVTCYGLNCVSSLP